MQVNTLPRPSIGELIAAAKAEPVLIVVFGHAAIVVRDLQRRERLDVTEVCPGVSTWGFSAEEAEPVQHVPLSATPVRLPSPPPREKTPPPLIDFSESAAPALEALALDEEGFMEAAPAPVAKGAPTSDYEDSD